MRHGPVLLGIRLGREHHVHVALERWAQELRVSYDERGSESLLPQLTVGMLALGIAMKEVEGADFALRSSRRGITRGESGGGIGQSGTEVRKAPDFAQAAGIDCHRDLNQARVSIAIDAGQHRQIGEGGKRLGAAVTMPDSLAVQDDDALGSDEEACSVAQISYLD